MAQEREADQLKVAVEKAASETQLADAFENNVGALVDGLASEAQQVSSSAKSMDEISDALAAQSESAMHSVDLGSSHVNSTAAAIEEMSMGEARTSVGELADSAGTVDQSSDEMIEVAESMARRTEEVQQGIRDFLATLRQG